MNWDDFMKWLGGCPKIHSRLIEGSYMLVESGEKIFIEANPYFASSLKTEQEAKEDLKKQIVKDIWDPEKFNVWVRVMPECTQMDGNWNSYARIAYEMKPELVNA